MITFNFIFLAIKILGRASDILKRNLFVICSIKTENDPKLKEEYYRYCCLLFTKIELQKVSRVEKEMTSPFNKEKGSKLESGN